MAVPQASFSCVLNCMKIKASVSMGFWNTLALISWATPWLSSYKKSSLGWCWILLYHATQKAWSGRERKKYLTAMEVLRKFLECCIWSSYMISGRWLFCSLLLICTDSIKICSFSNSKSEWFIVTYWNFKVL